MKLFSSRWILMSLFALAGISAYATAPRESVETTKHFECYEKGGWTPNGGPAVFELTLEVNKAVTDFGRPSHNYVNSERYLDSEEWRFYNSEREGTTKKLKIENKMLRGESGFVFYQVGRYSKEYSCSRKSG